MPKLHDNTSCSNMSPGPSGTVNSLRPSTSNKTKTDLRKKTKTANSKGAKLQANKITKKGKFANNAFSYAFSLQKLGFVNKKMPWIDAVLQSRAKSVRLWLRLWLSAIFSVRLQLRLWLPGFISVRLWLPTLAKSFFRLWLSVKTFDSLYSDSWLRLCYTTAN